jgi:hypothetical protein
MPLSADHPVLGVDYERGLAAGRDSTEMSARRTPLDERAELLWLVLVESPWREEAESLLAFSAERIELPALRQRAFEEGFAEALRQRLRLQLVGSLKPPKRFAAVLRQSTGAELAVMLQVLPRCRTWTEFFTRYHRAWELTSTSPSST